MSRARAPQGRRRARTAGALAGLGVAALGLALWRRDIPFSDLAYRYADDTSRWLALPDGMRLHLRDIGPRGAPALVFLHGYSASGHEWLPWAAELAGDYRLILLDLPGHGLTEAPRDWHPTLDAMVGCVEQAVAALGLRGYALVGSSMGGLVAWRAAARQPAGLAGLALVAAVGWPRAAGSHRPSPALRLLGSPVGRFLLRHLDLTALVRRSLRVAHGDARRVSEEMVRRCTDLARAPGHRAILTGLQLGGADGGSPDIDTVRAALASIRVPTLVMAGEADALVSVADARAFAEALPQARLVTYPGVGHLPMQQVPEASAVDLRRWLSTLAGLGRR